MSEKTPFTESFPFGSQVTLTIPATVQIGNDSYSFDHWEEDGIPVGRDTFITIIMNQNHMIDAIFILNNSSLSPALVVGSALGILSLITAGVTLI